MRRLCLRTHHRLLLHSGRRRGAAGTFLLVALRCSLSCLQRGVPPHPEVYFKFAPGLGRKFASHTFRVNNIWSGFRSKGLEQTSSKLLANFWSKKYLLGLLRTKQYLLQKSKYFLLGAKNICSEQIIFAF